MNLFRLIYVSRVAHPDNTAIQIEQILHSARKHNTRNDITGILCFSANCFLQCLEGSRENVNSTYQRILSDKRHRDPTLLEYQEIPSREFGDWKMGYVPDSSITNDLTLKRLGIPDFTPFNLSGPSSYEYLLMLRETVHLV